VQYLNKSKGECESITQETDKLTLNSNRSVHSHGPKDYSKIESFQKLEGGIESDKEIEKNEFPKQYNIQPCKIK